MTSALWKCIFRQASSSFGSQSWLRVSEEVQHAVNTGEHGVVALETTVITHGLPYPENLQTAKALEETVREQSSIPATIGLLRGRLIVGMSDAEIEELATAENPVKLSRRDLPAILLRKLVGGTTVSATMLAAKLSGIRVFATGGLGGVHRDFSNSLDVSADLTELSRTPVAVVCSGVKSILDIGKTLEYLETMAVPVVTFGPSKKFPGFFNSDSGYLAPYNTESIDEIAQMINTAAQLQLEGGLVVACPIPSDAEIDGQEIEKTIKNALEEARLNRVVGQAITPFLLKKVKELTGGASMQSNLALLKHNAKVASKIATRLAEISNPNYSSNKQHTIQRPSDPVVRQENNTQKEDQFDVVVIGGSNVDFTLETKDPNFKADGASYEGNLIQVCGGVGRNHADALTRLGLRVQFISAIGDDPNGQFLKNYCSHMNLNGVSEVENQSTPMYSAIVTKGDVQYGIQTSMNVLRSVNSEMINRSAESIAGAKLVLLDGNIPVEALRSATDLACANNIPVWYEPTDKHKLRKIFDANSWLSVSAMSPNEIECKKLLNTLGIPFADSWFLCGKSFAEKFTRIQKRFDHLKMFVVTLGEKGTVVVWKRYDAFEIHSVQKPKFNKIVSCSGSGDCGLIYGMLKSLPADETIELALKCAALSIESMHPVPRSLNSVSKTVNEASVINARFAMGN